MCFHAYRENGVPQGSVVSVTLFFVKISYLVDVVPGPIKNSLCVDDVHIAFLLCSLTVGTSYWDLVTTMRG